MEYLSRPDAVCDPVAGNLKGRMLACKVQIAVSSLEPLLTHLRTQVALFVVPFAVIVGWLLLGLYFFFRFRWGRIG